MGRGGKGEAARRAPAGERKAWSGERVQRQKRKGNSMMGGWNSSDGGQRLRAP